MTPVPDNLSLGENPKSGIAPPRLAAGQPLASSVPPPLIAGSPPPLPTGPVRKPSSARPVLAILLSLCLAVFLLDALVSLLDDSLIVAFGVHVLSGTRGTAFLFAMLMAILIYALMGLTPMIPKRLFLPLTLFHPMAGLAVILCLIYFYYRIEQVSWLISLAQVLLGLSVLYCVQDGFKLRWPLVPEAWLEDRRFSWLNLSGFLLVNALVLLPLVLVYLALCAHLAVDHFSDGFVALRPGGLIVQVRKYVRNDGKTIQLVPMSHIGEPDFYRKLSQSFPTNSLILMEGVTDDRNLLTNQISYKRAATSLGLVEQQNDFKPRRSNWVRADVDVEQFSTNTIAFLNLVMLLHSQGIKPKTILPLMQYSPTPHFQEQLFDDLLKKRNRRLLDEVQSRLQDSENLIVPWGAAHMPGIARELQKSGFSVAETREYTAIRFGARKTHKSP